MRINPRLTQNTLLVLGAAVAGPSLVVAGWRYPGSTLSRAFLVGTGIGLTCTTYYYFDKDIRNLLIGERGAE